MYRKVLLLTLLAVIFFTLGLSAPIIMRFPHGESLLHRAGIVHLHELSKYDHEPPGGSFEKMKLVSEEICAHIYPEPTDMSECFDRLSHGIAGSFDPHTSYRNLLETQERREREKNTLEGIGVTIAKAQRRFGFMILDLVPGGVAEEHGIKPGDEILAVDDTPIDRFRDVYAVARAIRGVPGTRVTLKMKREDSAQTFTASVTRKIIPRPQIEGEILSFQGRHYGLVRTRRFNEDFSQELGRTVSKLLNSRKKPSGLIISLEGNPGGSLYEVNNALDLFMDSQSFVLKRDRSGIHNTGYGALPHIFGDITNGLPILVVVNARSASASEIFAGAMQHFGRALIYGTKTFGKGTIQQVILLPQGEELSVTIAEYLIGTTEDWVPVQCVGITPDIFRTQESSKEEEYFECMDDRSLTPSSSMPDTKKRTLFREAHPKQYVIGLEMIDAYESYRMNEEKKRSSQ
ncbi:MAG: hypothetical protein A2494_03570 [Candidatus Lloydbacteria bacterium RIFOXYC12_FULL_46_25]|uniref:PDZ domain-containing protein n=1 Tax=Candidatus Lloydbacteria bacterium RIFOXYC12_FULL_46_25 TaxID=1798670 RepID=A0A1G2DZD2_9BACT|nr:MAG: hypothetical protein A2494_03570 [Candidatus Lloydbacteria bacterium RIFOXYC12_FULL_46_25]